MRARLSRSGWPFLPAVCLFPFLVWSGIGAAQCKDWVAKLVSAQGRVEMQPVASETWQSVQSGQLLCKGDKIRTLQQSRASLELPDQTYLSLDQQTTVVFAHVTADEPSWIELIRGALFSQSRTPKPLNIRTPYINAAIKGTEFLITAGPDGGKVTVFQGQVEVSNDAGSVLVSDGQTAAAAANEAPRVALSLHPRDTVQWALYFPPLLDLGSLPRHSRDPVIADAVRAYLAGDIPRALDSLAHSPEAGRNPHYLALRVSVLLAVGRVDEAEPLLAPYLQQGEPPAIIDALRSVINLARNRKAEALAVANRAIRHDPSAPAAWIARSYALQAAFDLPAALESADRAAETSPDDALILARRAELLAATGKWNEARQVADQAARLEPPQARALAVRGFAELRDGDMDAALESFRQASEVNPADPLAHFGEGLALIREGHVREGTAAMEMAASLDPGDSLIRSYLGKAYYEQRRNAVSEQQFTLAKEFDPQDPTPWFYDAIKKQTENQPVTALHQLQEAMKLNDNRAVYRSRLALDEDLASRGAALGRIYKELGFQKRALVESWKSLDADPTDYTAHRLLSDSYSSLPRHEIARVSELLQSQLLQPINITPVQPQLAESDLFLLGGLGPAETSLNEFNPLFQRNRLSLLASGLAGSNDTYGDEVVQSGLHDDISYSLGQFHYQTRGFRPNNAIDTNIYNAFLQGRVNPDLSMQAEFRHRDVSRGNLDSHFDVSPSDPTVRIPFHIASSSDTYRFGAHVAVSERSDLLGSFIHADESISQLSAGERFNFANRGDVGEVQYIQSRERIRGIGGGGYYRLNSSTEHANGYLYTRIRYPAPVTWTVGLSVESLDDSHLRAPMTRLNPKFGLIWNITPDTVLRLAAFQILKRSLLANQTLEPTQIAGFNQFYDDLNGTRASRFGAGLDHRFDADLAGGVETSWRYLEVPWGGVIESRWREMVYRAYLLWTPHPRWAATLDYYREQFDNAEPFGPRNTRTQYLPVSLAYFDPSGIFGRFKATGYSQDMDFQSRTKADDAVFLDLSLGYRLPRRHGLAEIQFLNLLDRPYRYEGLQDRRPLQNTGVPSFLPFPPEFTVIGRVTLAF